MEAIIAQLELNSSIFYQFTIFVVLFVLLKVVYFKPFLQLIEARRKQTIEDREAAHKLMAEAEARFSEYNARLSSERFAAREELEQMVSQIKKEESQILADAKAQAKEIAQKTIEDLKSQKESLEQSLSKEVDQIASEVAQKILNGGSAHSMGKR